MERGRPIQRSSSAVIEFITRSVTQDGKVHFRQLGAARRKGVTREPSPVIRNFERRLTSPPRERGRFPTRLGTRCRLFDGFPLPCHLRALGLRNLKIAGEVESQRSAAARSTPPWKSRGLKPIKARLPRPEVLGLPLPLGQGMRASEPARESRK